MWSPELLLGVQRRGQPLAGGSQQRLATPTQRAGEMGAAERMAAAQEAFVMADGPEADKRVTNVLSGLGFRPDQVRAHLRFLPSCWETPRHWPDCCSNGTGKAAPWTPPLDRP